MNRCIPRARLLPLLPLLALFSACTPSEPILPKSGTTTQSTATTLQYANPAAVSGHFRLVAEPASNGTSHLLLDLVGPAGTAIKGVALFATAGSGAAWGDPGGADPNAKAGTALTLGSPALFKSKLNAGDLQVGICQTGAAAATLGSAAIVTLALDLDQAGMMAVSGTVVGLAATAGKTSVYVDGNNAQQTMILDMGTLTAQ